MALEPWQLVVLLGAFAATAAYAVPRRKPAGGQTGPETARMQEALEQFMTNMEADNRDIVESVAKLQRQLREDNAARDERIAALERHNAELAGKLASAQAQLEERLQLLSRPSGESHQPSAGSRLPEAPVEAHAEPREEAQVPIRQRYAELFELHAQGKSTEAIAKRVSMHKGEVMLILQLAKQEEESRV